MPPLRPVAVTAGTMPVTREPASSVSTCAAVTEPGGRMFPSSGPGMPSVIATIELIWHA